MAFGTRTQVFNNLDATVGANEYSPGGGNAAIAINDADGFELQGVGCGEFRIDNENNLIKAFGASAGGTVDVSSAGSCVLYWFNTSVGATLTSFDGLVYDGANEGIINLGNFYPPTGGYTPIWIDMDQFSGTVTTSSLEAIGFRISNTDSGSGNKPNSQVDNSRYFVGSQEEPFFLNGTTDNTITFIRSQESNKTSGYNGLLVAQAGVDIFYATLIIGEGTTANTAVATTFSEVDKTFVFADQSAIRQDWLGWVVNLGNASTSFSLANCNFQSSNVSAATARPCLSFLSNAGTASIESCAVLGLKELNLQSSVTIDGGTVDSVSMTQNGAVLKNLDLRPRGVAGVAMVTDATFGVTTGINNCNVINQGAGHAFEFTSTQYPTDDEITFTNLVFDNSTFGVIDGGSSSAIRNSSGNTITVNLTGTSNTPTVTNVGVGSSTVFVASKTLTVNNIEADTELRLYSYTDLADPNTYTELAGIESVGTATGGDSGFTTPILANGVYSTTFSYNTSAGDIPVVLVAHNLDFEFFRETLTLGASENTSFTVFQIEDRQYDVGSV